MQSFNNYSDLWEDAYYHFKIIGDITITVCKRMYGKGILHAQKYESGQRCDKWQTIFKSNATKSIKKIYTIRGENYERS